MRVAVVDGQGGGIGRIIIQQIREKLGKGIEIIALGTNALATSAMLKAGADEGATGENAVEFNAPRVNLIVGSVAILAADTMLGELTPRMSVAIAESPAEKLLIPLNRCRIEVMGVRNEPLPYYIEALVHRVGEILKEEKNG